MKMMKIQMAVVAAISAFILTGCCACRKSQQKNYGKPFVGTEWRMVQFEGKEFDNGGRYAITFGEDGFVAGVGDCNRLRGTYTHKQGKYKGDISVEMFVATRIFCPDQDRENAFTAMLNRADNYRLDVYMMFLYEGNSLLAVFQADKWKKN